VSKSYTYFSFNFLLAGGPEWLDSKELPDHPVENGVNIFYTIKNYLVVKNTFPIPIAPALLFVQG